MELISLLMGKKQEGVSEISLDIVGFIAICKSPKEKRKYSCACGRKVHLWRVVVKAGGETTPPITSLPFGSGAQRSPAAPVHFEPKCYKCALSDSKAGAKILNYKATKWMTVDEIRTQFRSRGVAQKKMDEFVVIDDYGDQSDAEDTTTD